MPTNKPEAVVLWTLNETTHLLADEMDAVRTIFEQKQMRTHLGDRQSYNFTKDTPGQKDPDSGYASHNLMHEVDNEYDEYFVPISFKCIGSRFEESADNPELTKILQHYSPPDFKSYRHFWDDGSQPRYYPDEFKSRMANPDNSVRVVKRLQQAIRQLMPILISRFPDAEVMKFLKSDLKFPEFIQKVDAVIRAAHEKWRAGSLPDSIFRGLTSVRKWIGGLEADYDNAFIDLNAKCLDSPGSVLHSLYSYPSKNILHAHILTARNDPVELIGGLIHFSLWERMARGFMRSIGLDRRMATAGGIGS
mgnify:CR=1 FL=1